jgi:hypothetical protein
MKHVLSDLLSMIITSHIFIVMYVRYIHFLPTFFDSEFSWPPLDIYAK